MFVMARVVRALRLASGKRWCFTPSNAQGTTPQPMSVVLLDASGRMATVLGRTREDRHRRSVPLAAPSVPRSYSIITTSDLVGERRQHYATTVVRAS